MKDLKFSSKFNEFINFISKKEILLVSILFIIGFFLRLYLINDNLFFGYEQGRDLLVVKDIALNHCLVLIGPKTDIDGVFHGPFFYYLLVIPFLLSRGDPLFISVFLIFLNSLGIYFVYLLGKELFNKKLGLIAATILTFSFGAIVMARWLSNPPLIVPISCLMFYFLAKFLKGEKYYLILVTIFYGLAGQVNFINYLIFGFILLILYVLFFKQFKKTPIYLLILSLFIIPAISILNYVLFDLRHDFLMSNSLINLITKGKGYYVGYIEAIKITILNFSNIYLDLIFPLNKIVGFIFIFLSLASLFVYRNLKSLGIKILSIWIISPIILFSLLKYSSLYHYFAAVIIALVICTALLIYKVWNVNKFLGLGLILIYVLLSLVYTFENLPENKNVFFQSTQPDLKYADQIKVIDKIYQESEDRKFSFQAYTIPYWSQQGWEYLFWNQSGKNNKYIPVNNNNLLYVIIQKDQNNSQYQEDWLKNTVSRWGTKDSEFSQGALTIWKINTDN